MAKPFIQIEHKQLTAEVLRSKTLTRKVGERIRLRIRWAGHRVNSRVKKRMPLLTGRARGTWGIFTSGGTGFDPERKRRVPVGTQADAIFRFEDNDMTHVQGTHTPYTGRLNEGWSDQAPAGFIDAEHDLISFELDEGLARDMERLVGGNPLDILL